MSSRRRLWSRRPGLRLPFFRMLLLLLCCLCFLYLSSFYKLTVKLTTDETTPHVHQLEPLDPKVQHSSSTQKTTTSANQHAPTSSFLVDILSIGSNQRLEYLQAQRESFASHISVRNFFNVTENDDDDPFCASKLSKRNVTMISRFCRRKKKWNPKRQFLLSYLQTAYATERWLRNKPNPAGWMCAQTRPMQGFYKVIRYYKKQQQLQSSQPVLPDYLIIMDDDTYYNMQLFQEHFQAQYSNSSVPIAIAGCMVRSPIQAINFTIPFGGYGFILSRGYIEQMMRPIHCPNDHDWCYAIKRINHIDERPLFRNGMTLADLMHAYATNEPFAQFSNWTTGFCLHSDWYVEFRFCDCCIIPFLLFIYSFVLGLLRMWGYITNFYNVSRHVRDAAYSNVPHARMEAYLGSELNAGNIQQGGRRLCDFQRGNCHARAHACHYSTPDEMNAVTDIVRGSHLQQFRLKRAKDEKLLGQEGNNHLVETPSPSSLVVDILSIGSTDRARYHQAQQKTMGSHDSVRLFFNVTEVDDFDPLCRDKTQKLPSVRAKKILNWCRSKEWNSTRQRLMKDLQPSFHPPAEIYENEKQLPNWLCAQRRPIIGLHKVLRHYYGDKSSTASNLKATLPEFLIMMADDTYYNMKIFPEMFRNIRYNGKNNNDTQKMQTLKPSYSLAVSGCLTQHIAYDGNLTFAAPNTGFGLILSRAVLENLKRPINCGQSPNRDGNLCDHISKDFIGEKSLFVDGMGVIDLMYAYATHQSFGEFKDWTTGYCLQSDW